MRERISDNRSFIMGIAIIWVALYHIPTHTTIPVLRYFQDIGYGGVDIFIFVSGIGIYRSLENDSDVVSFLGRRLKRLLPSYIPFIILWMVVRFITYQIFLTEVLGNITMTGWWNGSGNQFNWYVDGILLFYLLAPYIHGILSNSNNDREQLCYASLLLLLAFVISLSFLHGKLLMAMSRLPLFVLGMIVASEKDCISRFLKGRIMWGVWTAISVLGMVALYYILYIQDRLDRWHYGLWWYPFILIAPGLAWSLGIIGDAFRKCDCGKVISQFVGELGKASFEIFLWHLFVFESARAMCIEGRLIWICLFIVAFVAGYGYYLLINGISIRLCFDRKNK